MQKNISLHSCFCYLTFATWQKKIHADKFRQTVISQSFQDFFSLPWEKIQVPGSLHGVMASGQPSNPRASASLPASTQLGCQVILLLHTDICCSIPSTRPPDLSSADLHNPAPIAGLSPFFLFLSLSSCTVVGLLEEFLSLLPPVWDSSFLLQASCSHCCSMTAAPS